MVEVSAAAGPSEAAKTKGVDRYRTSNLLRVGLARLSESSDGTRGGRVSSFVTLSPNGITVEGNNGGSKTECEAGDMKALSEALGKLPGKPAALVLTGETGLDLAFRIPNGPVPELKKMISEEIRYRSPFPESEIRYAWQAEEGDTGDWIVTAFVVLRSVIEPVLDALKRSGVTVAEFRRDSARVSFRARPEWLPGRVLRRSSLPRPVLLLGLAAALFAISVGAKAWFGGREISSLEAEAATARADIAAETQARQQRAAFDQLRSTSYRSIWLIGAVTEALPDGFWLDQLTIEEGEIVVTGFGPSAAEVTRLLSEIDGLSEARFASPVTRDNTQNIERFRIAADILEAQQ